MSLQEKFQVILPPKPGEDDGTEWKSFESQRKTFQSGEVHVNNRTADEEVGGKFNFGPPGMDISDQPRVQINNMPFVMAGSTDFSADTNLQSFDKGFKRQEMKGTDDQYTGEHVDQFYGEAVDEKGNAGFVERNNYLDRL
jgi:hypothetical protein